MVIKNFLLIFSLLNPIRVIKPSSDMKFLVNDSKLIAMAPQGASSSKATRVINAVKDEGCSSNISRQQKKDGTVIERETLTCTKETTIKPSGKVKQKPSAESIKLKGPVVKEFFKDRNQDK